MKHITLFNLFCYISSQYIQQIEQKKNRFELVIFIFDMYLMKISISIKMKEITITNTIYLILQIKIDNWIILIFHSRYFMW